MVSPNISDGQLQAVTNPKKSNIKLLMANNFITNNRKQKTLKGRLNTLISVSEELKFLVGFFYFSGWKELYENLQKDPNLKLKLLVGLEVDKLLGSVVEHGTQENDALSQEDIFNRFIISMGFALNNEELDTEQFYEQVSFFLQMLSEGRLLIRKTENPNHAKLYLFRLNESQAEVQDMVGQFVTGSSNLTRAGLSGQEEFNVEIKDYGFPEAEAYFDTLWERAIPITEMEQRKEFLIRFVQHKTQAATVTPFEAYTLILKTYLDLQQQKKVKPKLTRILEELNFKKYSYQIDAVNQALGILDAYNGVVIADVVGLGKSVIASLIASNLGKRGMVICPPGLVGDAKLKTGWKGYVENFKLYDWEVNSRGKLEEISETIQERDFEVIIVDEAHYFRNQDTADYESLQNICRDRLVILLTATPFNNSPMDIFSLLKLFIVPGISGITIEDNLESLFRSYNYRFKRLSDILKYHNSPNGSKRDRANRLYFNLFGEEPPIDVAKVRAETKRIANLVKNVISPVIIRRNRLDLKNDFLYSSELGELSKVEDPKELFYKLSKKQSIFYDRILQEYFAEEGRFKGAIYQPFSYASVVDDEENLNEEGNRAFQQQRNLYDFMRRLLVKRFESSFGAFSQSINRFLNVHEIVQKFIEQSGNKFILDRKLMEQIYEQDEDAISRKLEDYEQDLLNRKIPKDNTVYNIDDFQRKEDFLADIESDRQLFEEIKERLVELDMVQKDPKREAVFKEIAQMREAEPERKIILFSEYVDTVKHLEGYMREKFGNRLLICDGKVSKDLAMNLSRNFDAQHGTQNNDFDVLITSDKLSEGFNLNRAGAIINYDIPWNPTRVIQRVGRINRIGTKVFDKLYIFNFFPSEAGADVVKSREIASQKMFLIHNSLGEDAKMFDAAENPTASGLFSKLNQNPGEEEELNIITLVRNRYKEISDKHPEVIEKINQLPPRIKSAKAFEQNQLTVLRRKGLSLFAQVVDNHKEEDISVEEMLFEEYLPLVACEFEEPNKRLSDSFWTAYEAIKLHKPKHKSGNSDLALETRALTNLKIGLKLVNASESKMIDFMNTLIKDIRKYRTLSSRTLGRLGRKTLTPRSKKAEQKAFFDEVNWILNHLGEDYLSNVLKRVEGIKNEVIIAVENNQK